MKQMVTEYVKLAWPWAVVVVKWSVCFLLRQPEFEYDWNLQISLNIVVEKYKNKQKEVGIGPFWNWNGQVWGKA